MNLILPSLTNSFSVMFLRSSKLTSNLSRTLTNKSFSKMISAQGFTGYHSKMNITEDLTVKILSAM